MIAVIGGAGIAVRIQMKPQGEPEMPHYMGNEDTFDYSTLNVAAKMAAGDDIEVESSGCGANIALHLAKMGKEVAFASVVGDDALGLAVLEQMKKAGINVENVKKAEDNTSVKVEVLNILRDPQMSFANEAIYEKITKETAEDWSELLNKARTIVMDGNLPQQTIEYIASEYGSRDDVKIFFDPANHMGAKKVRNILDKFHCIMPGRLEAEAMAQMTILSEEQLMEAGACFEKKGVSKTIITMKGGGLYYKEGMKEGVLRPERVLSFAGTSGAGDLVSAAVVAGILDGKDIEEAAGHAMEKAAEFLAGRNDERPIDRR